MTFTEWYNLTHDDEWLDDYVYLYGFTMDKMNEYEQWCSENGQIPEWDA